MEVLALLFVAALAIFLAVVAARAFVLAIMIIITSWPGILGLYALIIMWSGGNSNGGVIIFAASVIANYFWIKHLPRITEMLSPQDSSRWKWLDGFWSVVEKSGIFNDLLFPRERRRSDTRTQTEILRDIERKIDDPYS